MSEITKLYENAGVLKECLSPCYINKAWRKTHDCPNCDNRENYPPFTAEKQIELIKFLLKAEHSISYYFYENRYGFVIDDRQDNYIEAEKFEAALAMIVNNLWQDLTEEEKQQVKGILE